MSRRRFYMRYVEDVDVIHGGIVGRWDIQPKGKPKSESFSATFRCLEHKEMARDAALKAFLDAGYKASIPMAPFRVKAGRPAIYSEIVEIYK